MITGILSSSTPQATLLGRDFGSRCGRQIDVRSMPSRCRAEVTPRKAAQFTDQTSRVNTHGDIFLGDISVRHFWGDILATKILDSIALVAVTASVVHAGRERSR